LNAELVHISDPNDKRVVNIRKLKKAMLRPEDLNLIPKDFGEGKRKLFLRKKHPRSH